MCVLISCRLSVARRFLFVGALVLAPTLVAAAEPDGATPPCVGGPGGTVEAFKIDVASIDWAAQVPDPNIAMIPEAQRAAMGAAATKHPSAKFLVVGLAVTNTSNGPHQFSIGGPGQGGYYRLANVDGVQFAPTDFGSLASVTHTPLNPGIPVKGTVVFDVPVAVYWLRLYEESPNPNGNSKLNVLVKKAIQCSVGAAGDSSLASAAAAAVPPTAESRQECIQAAVLAKESSVKKTRVLGGLLQAVGILGGQAMVGAAGYAGYNAAMGTIAVGNVAQSAAQISEQLGISDADANRCMALAE